MSDYPHTLRPELHKALEDAGINYWVTQGLTFWSYEDGRECVAYGYQTNDGPKLAVKIVGFTSPAQAIAATLGDSDATRARQLDATDELTDMLKVDAATLGGRLSHLTGAERIHEILYSCDSREELAERIAKLEELAEGCMEIATERCTDFDAWQCEECRWSRNKTDCRVCDLLGLAEELGMAPLL